MAERVLLGAVDWRHPSWVGGFYPADMPEEWRLTYYASQFSCVWLALESWCGIDPAEMSAWHDDVHSRFRFLLAADGNAMPPRPLGDKACMVISADSRIIWFDGASDLKSLATEIKHREAMPELYLVARDDNLVQLERARTLLELMGF